MANEMEDAGGKPEESSVTTIQASAGPSAATITEHQTERQEDQQQEQVGGMHTEQPSFAARKVGLSSYDKNVKRVAGAALVALSIGLLVAAIGSWPKPIAALLWAGACSAVGWAIGFLFGIPRTLQTDGQSEVTQTERETPPDNTTRSVTARRTTGVNTNLEQISDWLTKILVGVTLVQLGEVKVSLSAASALIAESLGGASMRSFASALMVYFALTGFLGSYLLTRLFLQRAFEEDIDDRTG